MAEITADRTVITAADGVPLKIRLAQAERRKKIATFSLVLPLLAFIVITFIVPIVDMIFRSVDNPVVAATLPKTLAALEAWDGREVPDEETFAILAEEMVAGARARTIGKVATRLNYEIPGTRSTITKTARRL